jgi:hypothetical protein
MLDYEANLTLRLLLNAAPTQADKAQIRQAWNKLNECDRRAVALAIQQLTSAASPMDVFLGLGDK